MKTVEFVSPLYAAILAIFYLLLAAWVIKLRWKFAQGIGDGGHRPLHKVIRVHANFSEYVPFTLILLFLSETYSMSSICVHVLGVLLVIFRLLHAFGLSKRAGASFGRSVGVGGNYGIMIFCSVFLIYKFLA